MKDERTVEYKDFCREIETAFGEDQLVKDPLLESSQFEVKAIVFNQNLDQTDQDDALGGLGKIAQRVIETIYRVFITKSRI